MPCHPCQRERSEVERVCPTRIITETVASLRFLPDVIVASSSVVTRNNLALAVWFFRIISAVPASRLRSYGFPCTPTWKNTGRGVSLPSLPVSWGRLKGETPQKREVFCRVSNILCRSLDTHIWIASLPDDCSAKICIKINTSKNKGQSVKCKKRLFFGHIGQYRSIYMTTWHMRQCIFTTWTLTLALHF